MYSKKVTVKCPYYGAGFSISVGASYKSAEAMTNVTVNFAFHPFGN